MITFKEYLYESSEQELERRYSAMRKAELDGSGLESRGEKMKYSKAKNAFFNLLNRVYPEETSQRVAYNKIATKYDGAK